MAIEFKDTCRKLRIDAVKGFTFIEVLIAIVILSVGLLAIGALSGGVIRGNNLSRQLTVATILAQDKMEDIRRLGYSNTPSTDTTTTEDYGSITDYPSFKRVTQTDVDNPGENMKTVIITVYWKPDNRSVILKTLLSQ